MRDYTTALYLLRCTQLGLHYEDMEHLTVGMITDMMIERSNDEFEYPIKATAQDFSNF